MKCKSVATYLQRKDRDKIRFRMQALKLEPNRAGEVCRPNTKQKLFYKFP